MEDILKDVLIKEAAGVDKVFIVDNLPKTLLYRSVKKMIIDYTDIQGRQNLVLDFEVLDNGTKRRTGAMEDQLLPGIERDDNDGAYVFHTDYNEAKNALSALDRYIEKTAPLNMRLAERVPYAAQPGDMRSAPLARHLIPRVVLPELVSPPVLAAAQVPAPRELSEAHTPTAPAERKIGETDHMAKMRAAKAAKAAQK